MIFPALLNILDKTIKSICILLFTSLLTIISLQIISRYIFHEPFVWAEEGAGLIFIWLCFLGGTVVHRKGTHISIDYFIRRFNTLAKKIISLTILLLTIILFAFLIFISIPLIERGGLLKAVTIPWINWGYIYLAVPVSTVVMCLYSIESLFNTIKKSYN